MLHSVDCGDICVQSAHIRLAVKKQKNKQTTTCAPRCIGFIYKLGGLSVVRRPLDTSKSPSRDSIAWTLFIRMVLLCAPLSGVPGEKLQQTRYTVTCILTYILRLLTPWLDTHCLGLSLKARACRDLWVETSHFGNSICDDHWLKLNQKE